MTLLRSLLFNLLFFGLTAVAGLVLLPLLLGPRRWSRDVMRLWSRTMLVLLRAIAGIRLEVTGREHLPQGAALVASRHESAFDTLVWFALVPDAAYVMKQELFRVPVYGLWARRTGHVGVDRAGGMKAVRALVRDGKAALETGRQLIIFPEGTRAAPGVAAPVLPGVVALAQAGGHPVVPVRTDSGLCWPRRSFLKHPGTIRIAVQPPLHGRERLAERLAEAISPR
ncbi:lysophospholipid acyltransferase family protein [Roseococcus sp. DSY-14]|uniref:lysophospholipid acyltransferase family protein n=1 Tax=Roseococcus sp. DSY-14 TaxID=3369650 RepID=UPI00387ABA2D